jgi:hypothetical protein
MLPSTPLKFRNRRLKIGRGFIIAVLAKKKQRPKPREGQTHKNYQVRCGGALL